LIGGLEKKDKSLIAHLIIYFNKLKKIVYNFKMELLVDLLSSTLMGKYLIDCIQEVQKIQ
jgi:hypothetical protein